MPRTASGQVVERKWKAGRGYALRVRAYGQRHYVTLGLHVDGWTRQRAEEELQNVLADVRRSIWIPPDRNRSSSSITASPGDPDGAPEQEPTFHRFASEWLAGRHGEISERTIEFYEWALTHHLLPYFAHWRLSEITIEAVDTYRRHKVQQSEERRRMIENKRRRARRDPSPRPVSAHTINMTLDVMQMVLALAVEYGHIPSNPAAGKRRRLKRPARRPIHLDSSQQIQALLDAATELRPQQAETHHRTTRDRRHPPVRWATRERAVRTSLARGRPRQRTHSCRTLEDSGRAARGRPAADPSR